MNALLPVVQERIHLPEARDYLRSIMEDEKRRDETVEALLKKVNKDDFALVLARTATCEEFNILSLADAADIHITVCKELYLCLRAWLVCSLKKGRYMPVEALKLTHPEKKYRYKAALRRIYEDIIHRDTARKYLPTNSTEADSIKSVITEYLKCLVTRL